MSEESTKELSESDADKLDLILLTLHRLQDDLHVAKCEINTAVRDVKLKQDYYLDWLAKLSGNVSEFSERLHGIELKQDRQNSQT